jgi:hypothetical protein
MGRRKLSHMTSVAVARFPRNGIEDIHETKRVGGGCRQRSYTKSRSSL